MMIQDVACANVWIFYSIGIVLFVILIMGVIKLGKHSGEHNKVRKVHREPSCSVTNSPSSTVQTIDDDRGLICRLPQEWKSQFSEMISCPFLLSQGILFDEIFCRKLDCNIAKFDQLLRSIAHLSKGKYAVAAKVGDMFDYRYMDSTQELPVGYRVREVKYCGLVKHTLNHECVSIVKAQVA